MLTAFDERPFHAATSKQDRDATFDAGAEPLPSLKRWALLERLPFRAPLAARLRDARQLHPGGPTGIQIGLIEEPPIGAIQTGSLAKDLRVPREGGRAVVLSSRSP